MNSLTERRTDPPKFQSPWVKLSGVKTNRKPTAGKSKSMSVKKCMHLSNPRAVCAHEIGEKESKIF